MAIKTLKSVILLLVITLLTFGCGARKVEVSKHKESEVTQVVKDNQKQTETSTSTNVKQQDKSTETVDTETIKNELKNNEQIEVVIEPSKEGETATYEFSFGDKIFKGSTSGKLILSSKNGNVTTDERIKEFTNKNKDINTELGKSETSKVDEKSNSSENSERNSESLDKKSDKEEPKIFNFMSGLAILAVVFVVGFILYLVLKRFGIVK